MRRWVRRATIAALVLGAGLIVRYLFFLPDPVPVTVF
jgi:hypothetical protein